MKGKKKEKGKRVSGRGAKIVNEQSVGGCTSLKS